MDLTYSSLLTFLFNGLLINHITASLHWFDAISPLLPSVKSGICPAYYAPTDSIWLLGGWPGPTNKIEYNRETNNFTELPEFSRGLKCYGQSFTQNSDTIYMFIDIGGSDYIAAFNIASNNFTAEAIQKIYVNPNREWPCVTNINTNYLLVLSGRTQFEPITMYDDFSIYDLAANQWIANGPPLSIPRYSFSCNVVNNMLYIIGGSTCNSSLQTSCYRMNSVEIINVSDINSVNSKSWMVLADTLSSPKSSIRSVAYHDFIYVLGGYSGSGSSFSSYSSEVDLIDTITNSITLDSNLMFAVHTVAVVVAGNTIYVFGGSVNGSSTDKWQYSYLTANPTTLTDPTIEPTIYPTNPTTEPTVHPSMPTFDPIHEPSVRIQPTITVVESTHITKRLSLLNENSETTNLIIYISCTAIIFLLCLISVGIIIYIKNKKKRKNEEKSLKQYIPSNTAVIDSAIAGNVIATTEMGIIAVHNSPISKETDNYLCSTGGKIDNNTISDELEHILKANHLFSTDLYQKLVENNIDLDAFRNDIKQSEINQLCDELNVALVDKIKVRKLWRLVFNGNSNSIANVEKVTSDIDVDVRWYTTDAPSNISIPEPPGIKPQNDQDQNIVDIVNNLTVDGENDNEEFTMEGATIQ